MKRIYTISNYYLFLTHTISDTIQSQYTHKTGRAWGTGSVYLNTGCSHEVTGGFPKLKPEHLPRLCLLVCFRLEPRGLTLGLHHEIFADVDDLARKLGDHIG